MPRRAPWFLAALAAVLIYAGFSSRGILAPDTAPVTTTAWSRTADDGRPVRAPNPWFFLERAYPFGRIVREDWQRAQQEARALRERAGARGSWEFRGPTNIGGRITDLAVDPTNPDIAFAGSAEGGVLRTTDRGQHWTPLFDTQASLAIGAVALDPTDPMTVYAGTGEVNPGGGSVAYGGTGLYRSTDRGDTWSSIGLETAGSVGRIRIDPTNPERIYVAAMGDLWQKGPDRGVYRTTDGGSNWERVLFVSDSTGAVDLILRSDQPQTIFAAMWERIRRPSAYRYGGVTCGVYKSTDGGTSWALVGGGLPTPSSDRGRIGLSICEAQPDVMHAVYADRIGYYAGLYRTTNGGASWTRTSDGALANCFSSYGWWFGNCRTHPTDPNRVFVLGLDFWRTTNGGSSWSEVSGGMHVDHHALEFGPGANPLIYEGNDGGVYLSTNGGSAWTLLPNQPITQFYRVALDLTNPQRLYGGAQDNGTIRTLTGSHSDWHEIYGGDGFQPLVHPTNPQRIWAQYQYGNLVYSSNGGSSFGSATSGISGSDRRNWNSPVCFDPTDPNRMYFGTQRVYRSTNGTSWTAISPDLTGGPGGGSQGQVYGTLTTIAGSPLDGQVIWAGSDDGHVAVTTNGGSNWTDVATALPDRWITAVRPSPLHRETCYVTISGFRWGSPLPHVYRTTNLGATWTAVAGDLPEAPANDLVVDPQQAERLFVATDVGVYETVDGGAHWLPLGGNLPYVVVTALALNPNTRILTSATYGRSFWSYDINQPSAAPEPGEHFGDSDREDDGASAPRANRLHPPRPNPAETTVLLRWDSGLTGPGIVEIVTVAGRVVWQTTVSESRGEGSVSWDLRDPDGHRVAAGVYYARLRQGGALRGSRTVVVSP